MLTVLFAWGSWWLFCLKSSILSEEKLSDCKFDNDRECWATSCSETSLFFTQFFLIHFWIDKCRPPEKASLSWSCHTPNYNGGISSESLGIVDGPNIWRLLRANAVHISFSDNVMKDMHIPKVVDPPTVGRQFPPWQNRDKISRQILTLNGVLMAFLI